MANMTIPTSRDIYLELNGRKLAVVQGYTVRETAEILGAPQGTVSSKLHRTLKKLRAQLEK